MSAAAAPLVHEDSRRRAAPFGRGALVALVVGGITLFALLLWAIGAGEFGNPERESGAHAASPSLEGYRALADLLEARGNAVTQARDRDVVRGPNLLILTPPHASDGEDLAELLEQRRYQGPTILILPKWIAMAVPDTPGWSMLVGTVDPDWAGEIGLAGLQLRSCGGECSPARRFEGLDRSGPLPESGPVRTLEGPDLVPVIRAPGTGALVSLVDDGGASDELVRRLGIPFEQLQDNGVAPYPLVVVAEPDLFNNRGLADPQRARTAVALVEAVRGDAPGIAMDLTLNGYGRGENLLTLAFRPPFLAATLCLLLAIAFVAWRAFLRFGPATAQGRSIALGKAQLVANSAGLVARSGRTHLLGRPYATLMRRRILALLRLKPQADNARIAAALDARGLAGERFTDAITALDDPRGTDTLIAAARHLHRIERDLT